VHVQVGFSTSNWWVSRVIRWFTRAKVSHAFLMLRDAGTLGDLVLEAEWCGWKLSTPAALTRGSTRIVELVEPKIPLEDAVVKSLSWLDEKYNYEGLLGMMWVCVGRVMGKRWRNPLRSHNSLFCSEAVVYVLQAAGYPGAGELDAESVDPEGLREFMGSARV
jgi:hypothetical protein